MKHEEREVWLEPNGKRDPRMSAWAQGRAQRDMLQARYLGEFVLAVAARVRHALRSAGDAMTLAYGRSAR